MSTPIRRALYGRLAGDTTLNALLGTPASGYSKSIYFQQAPANAAFPLVIFQKQSGIPTEAFNDPAAMQDDAWLVKGVDRDTSADDVEAIAERLDTLLQDAPLSIAGTNLLYLRRRSDVQYPETGEGTLYQHCGALYRLVSD